VFTTCWTETKKQMIHSCPVTDSVWFSSLYSGLRAD
jgi:hypothetical protein